jgi:hypothetical protein
MHGFDEENGFGDEGDQGQGLPVVALQEFEETERRKQGVDHVRDIGEGVLEDEAFDGSVVVRCACEVDRHSATETATVDVDG